MFESLHIVVAIVAVATTGLAVSRSRGAQSTHDLQIVLLISRSWQVILNNIIPQKLCSNYVCHPQLLISVRARTKTFTPKHMASNFCQPELR